MIEKKSFKELSLFHPNLHVYIQVMVHQDE